MKKIVALVLSLVMALSLCTVAFGYTGTVVYDLKDDGHPNTDVALYETIGTVKAHTNKDGTGNIEYYYVDWTEKNVECYTLTKGERTITVPVEDWDASYIADGWTAVNEDGDGFGDITVKDIPHTDYFIPCEQDAADCALYKNGSFNTWLMLYTDDDSAAFYDTKAVAQKATTAKPNCTTDQFFEDGYLCADSCHFYVEGGNIKLNVNGKIVFARDVSDDYNFVVWASHIFAKGVANDKTGYDVATCLICKGEFACTNDEAVATKNGYKISTGFEYDAAKAGLVYDENAYENGYDFAWGQVYATNYAFCWQLKAGTTEEIGNKTETETKTEGVESAKTFDAGIAMYVGMSLMSVAGTAVVIGKKKEF